MTKAIQQRKQSFEQKLPGKGDYMKTNLDIKLASFTKKFFFFFTKKFLCLFFSFTKINLEQTHRSYKKCKAKKFPDDNIEENLGDLGFGNYFLGKTPKLGPMNEKK